MILSVMNYTKNNDKKTVFITGGAGFIGSSVINKLLDLGHKIVVYDSFTQYFSPIENRNYQSFVKSRFNQELIVNSENIIILRGDTRNKFHLRDALLKYHPTHVLHLAGIPLMAMSDDCPEEAISGILQGTVNMLDILKNMEGIERFIFVSSSLIYGDFQYAPADENHPKEPRGVYGAARLSGETFTRAYSRRFGIPYTIIRPSAVYGPGDVNKRVVQLFVEKALEGREITLDKGAKSKHDFSYIKDVVEGFVLAMFHKNAENETFNITRGEGRSAKEISKIIQNIASFPVRITSTPSVEKNLHWPERGALDIKKAQNLLGYNPVYSLEDGVEEYFNWMTKVYRDNKAFS